ncbi:hypothetical protein BT69DRAFT_1229574 [Atractiella rhizophila]|nr:hypothetical protein BT69DRAFT_1229574 [Atractiella rhizophila]
MWFASPSAVLTFSQIYFEKRGLTLNPEAIVGMPLEGEGKVDDRVDLLYNQLTKKKDWVEALARADAVFVATHSQGSIVSTHLLARLIEQKQVTASHVSMVCMAANYLRFESDAARELFAFQDPDSQVQLSYKNSLDIILQNGVKITLVGSLNDQVVPLYSGVLSSVSHPSILRAVFIDAEAFQSIDFIANLIVFALRLKNAGLDDHGLIFYLSDALSGSLTGVGHSTIYKEREVYDICVRYHFECSSGFEPPTSTSIPPPTRLESPIFEAYDPRAKPNPYNVPWALRGLVEDPKVQELFGDELNTLREQYRNWKPVTKALKDVQWQMQPLGMSRRQQEIGRRQASGSSGRSYTPKL